MHLFRFLPDFVPIILSRIGLNYFPKFWLGAVFGRFLERENKPTRVCYRRHAKRRTQHLASGRQRDHRPVDWGIWTFGFALIGWVRAIARRAGRGSPDPARVPSLKVSIVGSVRRERKRIDGPSQCWTPETWRSGSPKGSETRAERVIRCKRRVRNPLERPRPQMHDSTQDARWARVSDPDRVPDR
jgi:hypothetical protein